jgi:predicted AlkP superfamily pyrophosphatase or phosphodiesterase
MLDRSRVISLFVISLCFLTNPCVVAAEKPKPKLIVAVVVDQFRYDYLLRFRDSYTGGIKKLLSEGAVFVDAHYPQYPTVTAVGHSTFLSGATPSASGIINNGWFERTPFVTKIGACSGAVVPKEGRSISSVTDDSVCLVGIEPKERGSSPRRLLVSTLGDELKIARGASKVIGISLKDRAAILPAGHMADAAYWFAGGRFVTSTYYMEKLPEWVADFNRTLPDRVKAYQMWSPVDGKPDDRPFCTMKADSAVRPCGGAKESKMEGKIENTPLTNEMLEDLAERAIENEQLGRHEDTDVLALSFSANDLIGHELGPDSPEVRDISIRTDLLLGKLFNFLDRAKLGEDKTLVVFTADHGVAPVPKVNNERKMPGGWVSTEEASLRIGEKLSAHFRKQGIDWFRDHNSGLLYLNYEAIAQLDLDAAKVRRVAADAARTLPHIARVFTRDDLLRGGERADRIGRAVQLGFYGPRSGDIILVPEPYYMFTGNPAGSEPGDGTTHLTPYSYDSHVPLIFFGPGMIRGGSYYGRVAVNDVAPTLAAILGVETPSGSSGRILSEILE